MIDKNKPSRPRITRAQDDEKDVPSSLMRRGKDDSDYFNYSPLTEFPG